MVALTVLLLSGCTGTNADVSENTAVKENSGYEDYEYEESTVTAEPIKELNNEVDNKTNNKPSIKKLLQTALLPLGNTMYIWGGGWNEEDTGAGIESLTIGVSPEWKSFADLQTADYNYKDYDYEIHKGLDCSGYIGWLVYNVLESESYTGDEAGYVQAGYVTSSSQLADMLADKGFGKAQDTSSDTVYHLGDIVSMQGHVWMVLAMCSDNSVLLIHSSPPGVRISGTLLEDGSDSLALRLAENIMKTCYPEWYERYPDCSAGHNYLENARILHWNSQTLSDDENILAMDAQEIMQLILDESQSP